MMTLTKYNAGRKYCSIECYTAARRKRMERVCPHCGKIFVNLMHKTKYCSRQCASQAQSEIMRAGGMQAADKLLKMHEAVRRNGFPARGTAAQIPDCPCPVCGKLMPHYRKACSSDCYHELRRIKRLASATERTCPICGKSFFAKGNRVYCSTYCLQAARKLRRKKD